MAKLNVLEPPIELSREEAMQLLNGVHALREGLRKLREHPGIGLTDDLRWERGARTLSTTELRERLDVLLMVADRLNAELARATVPKTQSLLVERVADHP